MSSLQLAIIKYDYHFTSTHHHQLEACTAGNAGSGYDGGSMPKRLDFALVGDQGQWQTTDRYLSLGDRCEIGTVLIT